MRIDTAVAVAVPRPVAFRFYGWLDYLRFVSAELRREWCPDTGVQISEGAEYEVMLRQGDHLFSMRFKTVKIIEDTLYEDEFLTWPVRGGMHLLTFEEDGDKTLITDSHIWSPPWYARAIVSKKKEEQTEVFQQRLDNAKTLLEKVYALKGDHAFRGGIFADCADAGIAPIIPVDQP